ncbi:hypothetical protein AB9X29_003723 [Vibrio vulnificus]
MRFGIMTITCLLVVGLSSKLMAEQAPTVLDENIVDARAVDYGLTLQEIKKYDEIMSGPRGGFYRRGEANIYSVLGTEATTKSEQLRYARLYRDSLYEYYDRLSKFMKVMTEVGEERFGVNPRIMDFVESGGHSIEAVLAEQQNRPMFRRMKIYVKLADCARCTSVVKDEIEKLKKGIHGGIDLYFVDADGDSKRIQQWAMRNQIDPEMVKSRLLTLNHDDKKSPTDAYPVLSGVLW